MTYRVIQWATRRRGPGRHRGRARPSRPRAGRLLGAQPPTRTGVDVGELRRAGPGRRRPPPPTSTPCSPSTPTACSTARCSPTRRWSTASSASGKNVVTPLGWFYPPPTTTRARSTPACARRRRHAARHRHPPGRHHRALPARGLGAVRIGHPRAGRGVLRHPHLRRARRHPRLDAVRHDARRGTDEHRWPTRSAPGSASRCGWWPTSSASTSTPSCARPTRWRWPPRPIDSPIGPIAAGPGRRPAVPVGGPRRRRAGDHRRRQLAHGRGGPRSGVDASGPRASASRSRSPATRGALVTFQGLHPHSIEAGLGRNPGIVATAMHCVNAIPYVCAADARPRSPTSTCRRSPAARHPTLRR